MGVLEGSYGQIPRKFNMRKMKYTRDRYEIFVWDENGKRSEMEFLDEGKVLNSMFCSQDCNDSHSHTPATNSEVELQPLLANGQIINVRTWEKFIIGWLDPNPNLLQDSDSQWSMFGVFSVFSESYRGVFNSNASNQHGVFIAKRASGTNLVTNVKFRTRDGRYFSHFVRENPSTPSQIGFSSFDGVLTTEFDSLAKKDQKESYLFAQPLACLLRLEDGSIQNQTLVKIEIDYKQTTSQNTSLFLTSQQTADNDSPLSKIRIYRNVNKSRFESDNQSWPSYAPATQQYAIKILADLEALT
jgi:hypothetical protein